MSQANYSVPLKLWQTTLEVKRSKFISLAMLAENRAQAERFIADVRALHPQANHVCWAFIAGPPNTTIRSMSDDGEPSGTAGMPMLKVIEHSGLGDIVVAVVRYFGGTKLGTGGLQRAYSEAVSLLLTDLPTQVKVARSCITLSYDYRYQDNLSRIFSQYDIDKLESDYQQTITTRLAIATSQLSEFKHKITNITAGNIQFSRDG